MISHPNLLQQKKISLHFFKKRHKSESYHFAQQNLKSSSSPRELPLTQVAPLLVRELLKVDQVFLD